MASVSPIRPGRSVPASSRAVQAAKSNATPRKPALKRSSRNPEARGAQPVAIPILSHESTTLDRAVADALIKRILPAGPDGIGQLILRPFVKQPEPVLEPSPHGFDSKNVYNVATLRENGTTYMIYRAEDKDESANQNTGRLGLAWSKDGVHFERYPEPILVPEHDYEKGGIEDPRIVKAGDTYVLTYTGFPGQNGYWDRKARLCLATSRDLIHWEKKGPLFPSFPPSNDWSKSGAVLPEKIKEGKYKGEYVMYFGDSHIWMAHSKDLVHWTPEEKPVLTTRHGAFDSHLVESGPPPIMTRDGILLIYNAASPDETGNLVYSVGAALFSKDDPGKLIARTEQPIMEPTESWSKIGYVDEVAFAQGLTFHDGKAHLYFGGADHVIGMAVMDPASDRRPAAAASGKTKPWLGTDGGFWKYFLPVVRPEEPFESAAVSNPTVIRDQGVLYMLYRAWDGSPDRTAQIGLAFSRDGAGWSKYPRPVITPTEPYEKGGVEDPRVAKIGKTYYATYVASSDQYGKSHVALATSENMITWRKHGPILEIGERNRWDSGNRKAAVIVPERINGRYVMYYSGESEPFKTSIGIAYSDDLLHWEPAGKPVALPRSGAFDAMGIEPGATPMVTKDGIVLFYNGWNGNKVRKAGAILFSKTDPSKIIDRTDNPVLEPTSEWEKSGAAPNEISANGLVDAGGWKINLYYGAAGSSIGLATARKKEQ